jgi:hypothetical protein
LKKNLQPFDTRWRPFPLKQVRSPITGLVETGALTGCVALLSTASEPDGVASGEIAFANGSGQCDLPIATPYFLLIRR